MMDHSITTCEGFNETWDLSMSIVPDQAYNETKLDVSTRLLTAELERIERLTNNSDSFFGLPSRIQELISKYKGIERLYDWQIDCLNTPAVAKRQNLLYSLPTSGGKTLVAEILMLKELVIRQKNVIFTLPYVALAQEKVRSLAPFGLDLQFFVEEYVGGSGRYPPQKHRKKRSLYVCTIEKAAGLVDSLFETKRINEIGMIVVDEVHLIGDSSRGTILEAMMTKLLFAARDIQIIAMSATIGNLDEIGQFLNAYVYVHDFRPIDLVQYVKCDDQVFRITQDKSEKCLLLSDSSFNFNDYPEKFRKIDPGCIGYLVREVAQDVSCLVFCSTKKLCSNLALLICQISERTLKEFQKNEKLALLRALNEEGQGKICPTLRKTIPYGVAYHHSGLTNAERKLLEEAFMAKTINCICCTSTLAAGINLPAKRVIITSPYVGRDFFKLSTYKQMSGRAGRTGLTDTGESFLLCQDSDKVKILDLLSSTMDRCESRMDNSSFMKLAMDAIGLGLCTTRSTLNQLFQFTLFRIQHENVNNSVEVLTKLVDISIEQLISLNALEILGDNEEYNLTLIAKAAMAGNLNIEEAQLIYCDLEEASRKGIILIDYLHLFYLITPYSSADEFKIDREVIISVFSDLSSVEKTIAEHLGITDLCLIQYRKHGKVNCVPDITWHKFIRSLIISDLWNKNSVWQVSDKFGIPRGTIHNFLMRTAAFASSIQRFTEALKMEKFENFPALIQKVVPRISYCCSSELVQLMQLPSVKIGRAKQLYKSGYKTVRDIANAEPATLVSNVDHLPRRLAYEIVAAAKLLMLEKAETLQEEADSIRCDLSDRIVRNNEMEVTFADFDNFPFTQFSTPLVKQF